MPNFVAIFPLRFLNKASQEEKDAAKKSQNFTEQLRTMFTTQFAAQQQTLGFLIDKIKPFLEGGGIGLTPEEKAAYAAQRSESLSTQFDNLERNLREQAGTVNGGLPSGALGANLARLMAARAVGEAGGQQELNLADAALKRQNFFNAAGVLNGAINLQSPNALLSGSIAQGAESFKEVQSAFQPFNWGSLLSGIAGAALSFIPGMQGIGALAGGLTSKGLGLGAGSDTPNILNP